MQLLIIVMPTLGFLLVAEASREISAAAAIALSGLLHNIITFAPNAANLIAVSFPRPVFPER